MNWARENPLLAGVAGVTGVGTLALGWLIWSASSHLTEVDERYQSQVNEFRRLAALTPFPDGSNVAKLEEQRKEVAAAGKALEEQFAAFEPAAESLDPAGFQDRLRKEVAAIVAKAKTANVKVADTFYLGFERYRAELPPEKAVPLLTRQLAAIRTLLNGFIDAGVESIGAINRKPVPGEAGAVAEAAPAAGTPPAAAAAARKAAAGSDLISRFPFDVTIGADQGAFRRAVSRLMEQRPLLVIRSLQVKNEKEKGPPRIAETKSDAAPAATPGKPAEAMRYVVGQEKLTAILNVEVIRYVPVPEKKG